MARNDGRNNFDIRPCKITKSYLKHPEGSVLIELGDAKVICNATVEEKVPQWLKEAGKGWITAEYGLLPRATNDRTQREALRGKVNGRTSEIMRLIGRSLRSITDLQALGERTVILDCDVIQADGGTRTASITGAFVALAEALEKLTNKRVITVPPLKCFLAAVSCGIVNEEELLDLNYEEDSNAQLDLNVIMSSKGELVEIQGTAEGNPFNKSQLYRLIDVAEMGINQLVACQKSVEIDYKELIADPDCK